MLFKARFIVLSILLVSLSRTFSIQKQHFTQNNSTFFSPEDDPLARIPVEFESNFPIRASASDLQKHVNTILNPLMPYIRPESNPDRRIAKRQTQQLSNYYTIMLYQYAYSHIAAAQIGPFTFSCRQATGELLIVEQLVQPGAVTRRAIPQNFEFQYHPRPGLWWFVKCVGFETGGSGLDITGVQKPGGDSGISPNALKSLVG